MHVKRRLEGFKRVWRVVDMSPSCLFSITAWLNCHVFLNVRSFYEGREKICVRADDICIFLFIVSFGPAYVEPYNSHHCVLVFQPITADTGTLVSVPILCYFTTVVLPAFGSGPASPPATLPLQIYPTLLPTPPPLSHFPPLDQFTPATTNDNKFKLRSSKQIVHRGPELGASQYIARPYSDSSWCRPRYPQSLPTPSLPPSEDITVSPPPSALDFSRWAIARPCAGSCSGPAPYGGSGPMSLPRK